MLRSRVITALILAAIIFSLVLLLPPTALTVFLALLVVCGGGWEVAGLAGLDGAGARTGWLLGLLAASAGLVWLTHFPSALPWIFGLSTAAWLLLGIWLTRASMARIEPARFQPTKLLIGGAITLAAFIAMSWAHFYSPWRLAALLVVIAMADIGAYFAGHWIGGAKLAPRISPGKTVAGAVGGLLAAAAGAAVCAWAMPGIPLSPGLAAVAGLVLAFISIVGDLTLSAFKRQRGVKDTSALLPGHGGLYDRMDSLGAAAPVWALLLWWVTAGPA